MKLFSILAAALGLFALTSTSHAGVGFDGCYLLRDANGAAYPAICLQGTMEEGISGSGVRLTFFHTKTDQVMQCMKSASSKMSQNSFEFYKMGDKELSLTILNSENGLKKGNATLGRLNLRFIELNADVTRHLLAVAAQMQGCN